MQMEKVAQTNLSLIKKYDNHEKKKKIKSQKRSIFLKYKNQTKLSIIVLVLLCVEYLCMCSMYSVKCSMYKESFFHI